MLFSPYPASIKKYCLLIFAFFFLLSCKKNEGSTEPPPPPPSTPTVATRPATSITYNTAIAEGNIINAGSSPVLNRGICYSIAPNPTVFSSKIEAGSGFGIFNASLTGLSFNTVYYYKAFAYNAVGLSYGLEESFKTSMPPPQLEDFAETIYIGSYNSVCAFNAQTGALKWRKPFNDIIYASPAYADGMVYITFRGNLYAFDTLGNTRWSYGGGFNYLRQSPIVKNGMVYSCYSDWKQLMAYDAKTGNTIWTNNVGLSGDDEFGLSDIEIIDNSVFINSKQLYSLNATTGYLKWKYPNGGVVTPVRLNNKLYAISNQHSLFALDLLTGQLLWEKTDPSIFSQPHGLGTADGKLFYTDLSGISALDTINGSRIWYNPVFTEDILHQGYSPTVTGDTGYFRTLSSIHLYNIQNGNLIWQVPGTITSNMTVYDNIIYYGATENGKNYLYAMDVRSRALKWKSSYSSDFPFSISSPCVVTKSGKVYRFGKIF